MIGESITPGKVVFFGIAYVVVLYATRLIIKMIQEGQEGY